LATGCSEVQSRIDSPAGKRAQCQARVLLPLVGDAVEAARIADSVREGGLPLAETLDAIGATREHLAALRACNPEPATGADAGAE
jgi:hypothetical protein